MYKIATNGRVAEVGVAVEGALLALAVLHDLQHVVVEHDAGLAADQGPECPRKPPKALIKPLKNPIILPLKALRSSKDPYHYHTYRSPFTSHPGQDEAEAVPPEAQRVAREHRGRATEQHRHGEQGHHEAAVGRHAGAREHHKLPHIGAS